MLWISCISMNRKSVKIDPILSIAIIVMAVCSFGQMFLRESKEEKIELGRINFEITSIRSSLDDLNVKKGDSVKKTEDLRGLMKPLAAKIEGISEDLNAFQKKSNRRKNIKGVLSLIGFAATVAMIVGFVRVAKELPSVSPQDSNRND